MSLNYLSDEQVVLINQRVCRRTGQPFGLMHPEALAQAVARPSLCIDGYEPFQEIWEKAAVLIDSLLKDKPFLRGNILTGCLAADLMLRGNGYVLSSQPEDADLITSVALQQVTLLQIAEWLKGRAQALR